MECARRRNVQDLQSINRPGRCAIIVLRLRLSAMQWEDCFPITLCSSFGTVDSRESPRETNIIFD